jgi:hypothetical protein
MTTAREKKHKNATRRRSNHKHTLFADNSISSEGKWWDEPVDNKIEENQRIETKKYL